MCDYVATKYAVLTVLNTPAILQLESSGGEELVHLEETEVVVACGHHPRHHQPR